MNENETKNPTPIEQYWINRIISAVLNGGADDQEDVNTLARELSERINDLEVHYSEAENRISKVGSMLEIQGNHGNWNYDPYMHGYYNGIALALSIMLDEEPRFRNAPDNFIAFPEFKGYTDEHHELLREIRKHIIHTAEYAKLPPIKGWSWVDAIFMIDQVLGDETDLSSFEQFRVGPPNDVDK